MKLHDRCTILLQVDPDSLAHTLDPVYCSCNANQELTNEDFKNKFSHIFSPGASYTEMFSLIEKQQKNVAFNSVFSGAYALLYFVNELSDLLENTPQCLSDTLDLVLLESKEYKAFFVHLRRDIVSSGSLSKLQGYIEENRSRNILEYDKFYLVVALSEIDARATIRLRSKQPINPLKVFFLSSDEYFEEAFYSPIVGTALDNSSLVFQSANPIALISKISQNWQALYDSTIRILGQKRFEAAFFFDESTKIVKLRGEYHRFPVHISFCDTKKSEIVSYEKMVELSRRSDGFHPMEKIFNTILSSDRYWLVHLGYDEIIPKLIGTSELFFPLESVEAAGISDSLAQLLVERGYEIGINRI